MHEKHVHKKNVLDPHAHEVRRHGAHAPEMHAYESLTPDVVLDALSDLGLAVDGRLTALSSYENRVYQAMLEDDQAVVAKFYRPARWCDEAIQEEHDFAAQLMAAEVPMVAPWVLQGRTLHHASGFAFSVSPRRGGRSPELDDAEVLEWVGRFIARLHLVGEQQAFKHRPELNVSTFGEDSRDWLMAHDKIALDQQSAWVAVCNQALNLAQEAFGSHHASECAVLGICQTLLALGSRLVCTQPPKHFADRVRSCHAPSTSRVSLHQRC